VTWYSYIYPKKSYGQLNYSVKLWRILSGHFFLFCCTKSLPVDQYQSWSIKIRLPGSATLCAFAMHVCSTYRYSVHSTIVSASYMYCIYKKLFSRKCPLKTWTSIRLNLFELNTTTNQFCTFKVMASHAIFVSPKFWPQWQKCSWFDNRNHLTIYERKTTFFTFTKILH
jgi:hypothetical protein